MQRKHDNMKNEKDEDLKDAILFNTVFDGLAEGAGFTSKEARRAMSVILIHNTADFIINAIIGYFFAADSERSCLLRNNLLTGVDFLKKVKALKSSKVIDNELYKSLEKLNDIRVAVAHGKEKDDPRLQYKKQNILYVCHDVIWQLDEETVQKLLALNEKIRRSRIFKDKWPEKPFIHELYDRDRK